MPSLRLRLCVLLLVVAALVLVSHLFRYPGGPGSVASSTPSRVLAEARPVAPADATATAAAAAARQEALARLAYSQSWDAALPPAMAAFRAWTDRYRSAPTLATRLALEPEGLALALDRRPEMRRMIVTDPQRALAVTVPAVVRQALPPAILAELESRHAGRGEFALQASEPAPGEPRTEPSLRRIVYLGGVTYNARSYGRRESQLTKEGASLHGIALDGEFALHENPVRLLEPGEIPPDSAAEPEAVCAACALAMEPVAPDAGVNRTALEFVEADGRLWRLHEAELGAFEQRALDVEAQPGPRVRPLSYDPGAPSRDATPSRAAATATPHTVGTKQVLVIRTDFSDFPGEPVSQSVAETLINGAVREFLEEVSYGETTLVATATAQVYRLPRSGASYATTNDRNPLHTDARNLAAAHHTLANFDRIIVVFPNIGTTRVAGSLITFGGLANISGTYVWINGTNNFGPALASHELGHTYGLRHGNLWRVTDGNPVSSGGTTLEYGDPFDMMGSTSVTGITRDNRHHFNMWSKNRLGWLPDEAVTNVTRSGTYRIHRFDTRAAPRTRPLALQIFRDGVRTYWVGLRQNFSTGTLRADGAYVVWGHNQRLQTQLLDLTTPGNAATDAALAIGSTFTDADYGITLKPVARGGDEPAQWLDVEVTLPAAPPNVVSAWGRDGVTFYDTVTGEDILPAPETKVPMGLIGVQAIASGDQHAIALKSDGTVVAWGDHVAGQISVPAGLANVVAVAAGGDVSGVVLRDGTVRLWGETSAGVPSPPADLTGVTRLAIGRNHALALKSDGTVVGWGANNQGQSTVPANLADVIAVAAGAEFSVALKRDGTVTTWGYAPVRLSLPAGLSNVTAISAFGALTGGQFAVALKSDGTIVAWGANNTGQSTVPPGTANIAAIAAGAFHTVLLRQDGTVTTFGSTTGGRAAVPPALPRAIAVSASSVGSFALIGSRFHVLTQPRAQAAVIGDNTTFRVEAEGSGPLMYQWRKDGVAILGATANTYTIAQVAAGDAGNYDVIITDGGNTLTSSVARLTVGTVPPPIEVSRIANLSIRTNTGTDAQTLIVGFVVGGAGTSGTKPLLVRGVGPTLESFGVTGALADPKVELYDGGSIKLLENDNWNTSDGTVFPSVGAFPLAVDSRDAALYNGSLASGSYSAKFTGAGTSSGIVLAEIYDATSGVVFTSQIPRLVNVSARTFSGTGNNVLIAGFAVAGRNPKNVLIRAIGPSLTQFGVDDVLADPKLELFDHKQASIQQNDNWGGASTLTSAFDSVGAFRLDAASRDAALLISLQPGTYTTQVSGVGDTTGVALVEIYEVP